MSIKSHLFAGAVALATIVSPAAKAAQVDNTPADNTWFTIDETSHKCSPLTWANEVVTPEEFAEKSKYGQVVQRIVSITKHDSGHIEYHFVVSGGRDYTKNMVLGYFRCKAVAEHASDASINPITKSTQTASSLPVPTDAEIADVAGVLKHQFRSGGLVGLAASVQRTYDFAKKDPSNRMLRIAMLYDMSAFRLYQAFSETGSNVQLSYYAKEAYLTRIEHQANAAFGGWNEAAKSYLIEPSRKVLTHSDP